MAVERTGDGKVFEKCPGSMLRSFLCPEVPLVVRHTRKMGTSGQ